MSAAFPHTAVLLASDPQFPPKSVPWKLAGVGGVAGGLEGPTWLVGPPYPLASLRMLSCQGAGEFSDPFTQKETRLPSF